ncbi:MAG: tetrahydrofolate dehydrogenase/cyclohydrolase catalytic domain-containing protein [Candidatus Paceibacterota bacterium]
METKIIDGKKLRNEILEKVKQEVTLLSFTPVFCDVLVGEDKVSAQYVAMKGRTAESVGIKFHNAHFASDIETGELVAELKKLNEVENMCGIIVQLPLPKHIDKAQVFEAINPLLDVDCLGAKASEKFYNGDTSIGFPTALSCMVLLDSINIDLNPSTSLGASKKIVVLGQGMLVGRPVTALLRFRNLSPITVDINTLNKEDIIKDADIIISATGQGQYLTGEMIKSGAVIIDAGTSESNGSIVGDVNLESVKGVASYVSPVPGGVGPVTVAMLLKNVLTVAKKK